MYMYMYMYMYLYICIYIIIIIIMAVYSSIKTNKFMSNIHYVHKKDKKH